MISSTYYNTLISSYLSSHSSAKNSRYALSYLPLDFASIVKENSRLPQYKINLSEDNQEFMLCIKDAAVSLYNSLSVMSDEMYSPFSQKRTVSELPSIVTVAECDSAPMAEDISIELQPYKLAAVQINKSNSVPADGSALPADTYSFSLNIEDNSYLFKYTISNDTKNSDILSKLADFITKADVGVSAFVNSAHDTSEISLSIQSVQTGAPDDLTFTLKDTAEEGIVSAYGLNNVIQKPSNLEFTMDGLLKTSLSNSFTLNKSLAITVHEVSETPVLIHSVSDADAVSAELSSAVGSYNSLLSLAKERPHSYKCSRLSDNLFNIVNANRDALNSAKISIDSEGFLSFKREDLESALRSGALRELFTNENRFNKSLKDTIAAINSNPIEYLDKVVVTYKNTQKPQLSSPYVTSVYSGLIFNGYC